MILQNFLIYKLCDLKRVTTVHCLYYKIGRFLSRNS